MEAGEKKIWPRLTPREDLIPIIDRRPVGEYDTEPFIFGAVVCGSSLGIYKYDVGYWIVSVSNDGFAHKEELEKKPIRWTL